MGFVVQSPVKVLPSAFTVYLSVFDMTLFVYMCLMNMNMKSYLLLFSAGHKFLFDSLFKVPGFVNIYDYIIIVKTHNCPKTLHHTLSFCNHLSFIDMSRFRRVLSCWVLSVTKKFINS